MAALSYPILSVPLEAIESWSELASFKWPTNVDHKGEGRGQNKVVETFRQAGVIGASDGGRRRGLLV